MIQAAKSQEGYCELLLPRSDLCVYHETFGISKSPVKNTVAFEKSEYYHTKNKTGKINHRIAFRILDKALPKGQTVLPNIIN